MKWGERWVVGGDFTMVLLMRDRLEMGTRMGENEKFKEMIDMLELVDHPLGGGRWTWSSGRECLSWSRID